MDEQENLLDLLDTVCQKEEKVLCIQLEAVKYENINNASLE